MLSRRQHAKYLTALKAHYQKVESKRTYQSSITPDDKRQTYAQRYGYWLH